MSFPLKFSLRSNMLVSLIFLLLLYGCKNGGAESKTGIITEKPADIPVPEGMVWVPGGTFTQGAVATDEMALNHEKPAHEVAVDGFFMDQTEVTNAEFKKFVQETGYVTVAERDIKWEEIKKQVPPGTPRPPDSVLQPGSLTFEVIAKKVTNLQDFTQWWNWNIGANWRHPDGPESTIEGKDEYPVVHIAYEDALAYCKWSGTRLPTEAEWEYASRAGKKDKIYAWGNSTAHLTDYANTWQGDFPNSNTAADGFVGAAPVKSYPENGYGLFDMAGNVWEWTSDWYNVNYYKKLAETKQITKNPSGADTYYNPANPSTPEKVIKGGSFLCHSSYCASYRSSARMATSLDSGLEHLGFRTVKSVEDFKKER